MTTQRVAEIEQTYLALREAARKLHKVLIGSHTYICMVCGVCEDRETLWERRLGNYEMSCRHCNGAKLHSAYNTSLLFVARGAKVVIPGIGVEKPELSLDFNGFMEASHE
jgi:hypothetical protein